MSRGPVPREVRYVSGALEARSARQGLETISAAAIDAARAAGSMLSESFSETLRVEKVVPHDIKLEIDRTCEEAILNIIFERFPTHGILSEEYGYLPAVEPFLWIVDPLDGTVNYFHRIPIFSTSVACYRIRREGDDRGPGAVRLPDGSILGEPIVGVVFDPSGEELYVGVDGKGAEVNGRPLRLEPLAGLSQSIVTLALNNRQYGIEYAQRLLPVLLERARKVRSFGSTAMDIAYVAAGRTGAFLQKGTNLWDFAAASVILREAGGIVEAKEFVPGSWQILACNPGIYRELKNMNAI